MPYLKWCSMNMLHVTKKKHSYGHYCVFSHYGFQIHIPLTFAKNSAISKETVSEYLSEINYSKSCSGQERSAYGKDIKSTAGLDWESGICPALCALEIWWLWACAYNLLCEVGFSKELTSYVSMTSGY